MIELPAASESGAVSVEAALSKRRTRRGFRDEPLSLTALGQLLWAGQGVTDAEGRRTAPSAGALYPLETYVTAGKVDGIVPGIYRYRPASHTLNSVTQGDARPALAKVTWDQEWLARAPALIVFAAVHERTMAKYGERGIRYAHIEVGHAVQNVYLQAEALGLAAALVGAFDDMGVRDVAALSEREMPLALIAVGAP